MSPAARRTDPATSHAAARSAEITLTQRRILTLLAMLPLTDDELWTQFALREWSGSPSGIRSRRSELVRAGKVMATGQERKTKAGRWAIVWGVTE